MQQVSTIRFLPAALLVIGLAALEQACAQTPPAVKRGVCAQVRIKISQQVVLTRSAFRATLEIANAPHNAPLEKLSVTLRIRDQHGQEAGERFGIRGPETRGLNEEGGSRTLAPGSQASMVWTIIPGRDAAPEDSVRYQVGGKVAYSEGDVQIELPFLPVTIAVLPAPDLRLHYFLPRQVDGDDPFTSQVTEPAVPFSLGVILENRGKGRAGNVTIASSQPRIVENKKGLLVDFSILETQVDGAPATPSLAAELGSVGPSETAVVVWTMKSSMQGEFIEFNADFEHVDDLGGRNVSIMSAVEEHELAHVVRVSRPQDDGRPDFLANEIEDDQHMPDTVYRSDGTSEPVHVPTHASLATAVEDGAASGEDGREVVLRGAGQTGLVYIRKDNPAPKSILRRVFRSDGTEMAKENFWTTSRTVRLVDQPDVREEQIHLFDDLHSPEFEYKLVFLESSQEVVPPAPDLDEPAKSVTDDVSPDVAPLPDGKAPSSNDKASSPDDKASSPADATPPPQDEHGGSFIQWALATIVALAIAVWLIRMKRLKSTSG